MVFGFGFNKAKVQASAEKNVKQGKLHAAIADYEKVSREDPKDLNILNTIGDLYARLGDTEQATSYFKRVGDAYASEGFTVKAIAMYKKLTKQNPAAAGATQKLAELYTQQGLFNDARAQYMQLVDQHLRSGDADTAAGILQKVLELDPENPNLQSRLAELYVRLGKKAEARDIYFRSAQSLRSRGLLGPCDEALEHVLRLDPGFSQAAMLRGQVKLDHGDAAGAIRALEKLADIDSRAEGLRILLRARVVLGQVAEVEPLAKKLLTVFNDPTGLAAYVDALIASGAFDQAVELYREHAEGLMRANAEAFGENLGKLIGRVKNNSRSLEILGELFQRIGNTTHLADVTELLAHAYVQENALEKARDLYHKLADMEPENPLHAQNYRQIVARMGDDSTVRELTPEQGAKAFLVEELEQAAPIIDQNYPADVAAALRDALTDAELFASYNLPARAIPALEAVLPRAPQDIQVNQRLASLYVRMARWADAVHCCDVLASVLTEAGHVQEGSEYREMAVRYRKHAGLPLEMPPAPAAAPPQPASVEAPTFVPPPPAVVAEIHAAAPPEPAPVPPAVGDAISHEIDLSEEWERVMSSEPPVAPATAEEPSVAAREPTAPEAPRPAEEPSVSGWEAPVAEVPALAEEPSVAVWEAPAPLAAANLDAALGDLIEEVRFYVAQQMWDEGRAACARAKDLTSSAAFIAELDGLLGSAPAPEAKTAVAEPVPGDVLAEPEEPAPAEFAVAPPEPAPVAEQETWHDATPPAPVVAEPLTQPLPRDKAEPAAIRPSTEPEAGVEEQTPAVIEPTAVISAVPEPEPVTVAEPKPASAIPSPDVEPAVAELEPEPFVERLPVPEPERPVDVIPSARVPDIPATLPESLELPPEVAQPALASAEPHTGDDVLADFALDLEESLGADFAVAPPPPAPVSLEPPVVAAPQPAAYATPAMAAAPALAPIAPSPGVELVASDIAGEPASPLADLFAEFKQDVEAGAHDGEDPETHYNLGVAFKEMGLLDEAIGELQKVCQGIEHGQTFPRVIEAYTWLADCFLQKGVPEAAIHWYEKALRVAGVGDERALAIHYELACAQEAAGNLIAARQHFMHVLSVNIDYRDVAERIKALRS